LRISNHWLGRISQSIENMHNFPHKCIFADCALGTMRKLPIFCDF
jgi:hypothetical protein